MILTLLDDYQQAPGRCFLCKAARRHPGEKIVDVGVMVDSDVTADPNSPGFQVLYRQEPLVFCEACIVEIGHAVGMCSDGEADATLVDLIEASAERDQALEQVSALREALDALTRARYGQALAPKQLLAEAADDEDEFDSPQLAFECEVCGRYFSTAQGLNAHGRAHKEHPVDA